MMTRWPCPSLLILLILSSTCYLSSSTVAAQWQYQLHNVILGERFRDFVEEKYFFERNSARAFKTDMDINMPIMDDDWRLWYIKQISFDIKWNRYLDWWSYHRQPIILFGENIIFFYKISRKVFTLLLGFKPGCYANQRVRSAWSGASVAEVCLNRRGRRTGLINNVENRIINIHNISDI
jgi:hypothetical protein